MQETVIKDKKVFKSLENLEDSEFEKRTAEALERYEKGQFTEMSAKKFLKTLGKW